MRVTSMSSNQTNTYQMVLATDEMMTIAMFNYDQVEWITHLDNYDGLKGPAAFVSIPQRVKLDSRLTLTHPLKDWLQRWQFNASL